MNNQMRTVPIQRLIADGKIEYTVAVDLNYGYPTPVIRIREWDSNKRLRVYFYFQGEDVCITHADTCTLHIARDDGEFSSVEPLPYEDGTNCLAYDFTKFFGEVPGIHKMGVTFRSKEPNEKGVYDQISTPNIILEVIDGPFDDPDTQNPFK